MLRAAMVVDQAIPTAELQCEGVREGEKRAPSAFGLGIGAAEAAIVLAALALGVLWRRRPPSKSG